eukprot:CAMPEP_0205825412 /NCGR_PEP_ID=MMETSP0206-20130828/25083_1 /ASSEMBLY_ACC=CAM_ASM_000279 /TAXON_ID=36767 /ORGANISM="Euplotes focardii, Strain TN1" /LENGTH=400 /DNA_ID=CAMNT_0053124439 /DNA_START=73 /DNA_END=1275 /DNA_ORIENTATION=-
MILSGATLGIVLKLQSNVERDGSKFEHPFFLVFVMFIGEALCILMYIGEKMYLTKTYGSIEASPGMKDAREKGLKTDINPLLLAIPMLCDSAATGLLMIAYINIPASIAQMMGGFVVFVVAILSIIFLKRVFYRHHWLGLVLVFIGIALVAAAALIETDDKDDDDGNVTLGVVLMLFSILVQGTQFIVEEKLLGSYYLSPFKAVGWEGITGCLFWSILLIIFQFIPCENEICNNGKVENSKVAFEFIGDSLPLVFFLLGNIIFVAGMNGLGMIVTKYASAATRVILQQSKTVLVWGFFLIYPHGGHETFKYLQLTGFIVLLIGVILYNEFVVIPILGFNQYTKSAIAKRAENKASIVSATEDDMSSGSLSKEKAPLLNGENFNTANSSPVPKGVNDVGDK